MKTLKEIEQIVCKEEGFDNAVHLHVWADINRRHEVCLKVAKRYAEAALKEGAAQAKLEVQHQGGGKYAIKKERFGMATVQVFKKSITEIPLD